MMINNNWHSYSTSSIQKMFDSIAHCLSLSQSLKSQRASLKRSVPGAGVAEEVPGAGVAEEVPGAGVAEEVPVNCLT